MANYDVGQLNIEITASADSATLAIDKLASSLANLTRINLNNVSKFNNTLGKLGTNSNLQNLGIEINKIGSAFNNFNVNTESVNSINNFIKAISKVDKIDKTKFEDLGKGIKSMIDEISKSKKVDKNIVSLIGNITNLTNTKTKIKSFAESAHSSFSIFTRALNGVGSFFQNFKNQVIQLTFGDVLKKANLKQFAEYASSLAETQNIIDNTFGTSAQNTIDKFSKVCASSFGMNTLSAKKYAGTFQALGTSMGESEKRMSTVSIAMNRLVGDYASFFNKDTKDVSNDFTAVFTGQTKAMRKYGIDLTQTNLEEYARQQGISKSITKMTQYEKSILRFNYIVDRSKNTMGDFERTQTSFANQTKLLGMNFEELGGQVGIILTNVLKPILYTLNQIIQALTTIAKEAVQTLSSIFGWETEISGGVVDTSDIETGTETIGDNLDTANKNAKKLKQNLSGIDEMHVLKQEEDTTTDTNTMSQGNTLGLDWDDKWSIEWQSKLTDTVAEMVEKIKKIIEPIKQYIVDIFSKVDWAKILTPLSKIKDVVVKLVDVVGKLFIAIKPLLTELLGFAWNFLCDSLNTICDLILAIPTDVLVKIGGAILGIGTALLVIKGLNAVVNTIQGIGAALSMIGTMANITGIANAGGAILGFGESLGAIVGFAAPILLVAGAIAGLVYVSNRLVEMKADEALSLYGTSLKEITDKTKALEETTKNLEDIRNGNAEVSKSATELKFLIDKYEELANKTNRTASENALMVEYSKRIQELCPQLKGEFDDLTGAYKGNSDALREIGDAQVELYKKQAMEEYIKEQVKAMTELQITAEKTKQAMKNMEEKGTSTITKNGGNIDFNDLDYIDNKKELKDDLGYIVDIEYEVKTKEYQKLDEELKKQQEAIQKANDELNLVLGAQENIKSQFSNSYNDQAKAIEQGSNDVATATQNGTQTIAQAQEEQAKVLEENKEKIKNAGTLTEEDKEQMKNSFNDLMPTDTLGSSLGEVGTNAGSSLANNFITEIDNKKEEIKKSITDNVAGNVKDSFETELGIKDGTSQVFSNYADNITTTFDGEISINTKATQKTMNDYAKTVVNSFYYLDGETTIVDKFFTMGSNIVQGLINGLRSKIDELRNTARELASAMNEAFEDEEDIHSPSKLYQKYGSYIVQGLENGLNDNEDIIASITQMTDDMNATFSSVNWDTATITDSFQNLDFEKPNIPQNTDYSQMVEDFTTNNNTNNNNVNKEEDKPIEISIQVDSREIARATANGNKRLGYSIRS